jgi:L-glyceraldehyde 3-phosphate reductase
VRNTAFTPEEIKSIDVFAEDGDINLWKKPSTDQRP